LEIQQKLTEIQGSKNRAKEIEERNAPIDLNSSETSGRTSESLASKNVSSEYLIFLKSPTALTPADLP
jgi:hypothetical protein